jgi:hypothetical protein
MANQDNAQRGNQASGAQTQKRDADQEQRDRKQAPRQEVQDQLTGTPPGVPGGPGSWQSDSEAEARNKAAIAGQQKPKQRRGGSKR